MASLGTLLPYVAQQGQKVVEEMQKRGWVVTPTQTLRTWEEQEALYAKGRTRAGSRVTNARGGESWHNYGVAVDFCFGIGEPFGENQPWATLGEVGKQFGFSWGGDWTSFKDRPHLEMTFGLPEEYVFTLKKMGQQKAMDFLLSKCPQVQQSIAPWALDTYIKAEKLGFTRDRPEDAVSAVELRAFLSKAGLPIVDNGLPVQRQEFLKCLDKAGLLDKALLTKKIS